MGGHPLLNLLLLGRRELASHTPAYGEIEGLSSYLLDTTLATSRAAANEKYATECPARGG